MERKLIDYRLFDPSKQSLFKIKANEKARFRTVHCERPDQCDAYKDGQCAVWSGGIGMLKCPYSKINYHTGYTRRAKKSWGWIQAKKDLVKGIKQLDPVKKMMTVGGEYIFFNYSFWELSKVKELADKELSSKFIPAGLFTVDIFNQIVKQHPQAMFGGEIRSYQNETVPKMVSHCQEWDSEFFKAWQKKYQDTAKRFKDIDYIGRTAYAYTVRENVEFKTDRGVYVRLDDWFKSVGQTGRVLFAPFDRTGSVNIQFKLTPKTTVKITKNCQIEPGVTQFAD